MTVTREALRLLELTLIALLSLTTGGVRGWRTGRRKTAGASFEWVRRGVKKVPAMASRSREDGDSKDGDSKDGD